jgi:hypothetical protein
MMPQKRNPDMLELIRGRSGNLIGSLVSLLTIVKGLPIGYNRDLQEDKRHIFAAFDLVRDSLEMAARVVASATFDAARIARSGGGLDHGYLDATALAEFLVAAPVPHAVPFRTAHQIAGSLVRLAESTGRHSLAELSLDEFQHALREHGQGLMLGREVYACLGAEGVARHYRSSGHAGIGPGGYRAWLAELDGRVDRPGKAPPRQDGPSVGPVHPAPMGNVPTAHIDAHVTPTSLFGEVPGATAPAPGRSDADAALIEAYVRIGRSLDDLPYTPEFETMHSAVRSSLPELESPRALLHRLHNLRKAGKLPKVGKTVHASPPPRISPEEEQLLAGIVIEFTGTLGQRDRLPYDDRFEAVVTEFNQRTGRMMTPHDVWRLVAKLAK